MLSKTGFSSPGEELITRSTSADDFSRSIASSRSRVRRAISFSELVVAVDRSPRTVSGEMDRFGVVALRRPALPALPTAFERRFMALPSPQDEHGSGSGRRTGSGLTAV